MWKVLETGSTGRVGLSVVIELVCGCRSCGTIKDRRSRDSKLVPPLFRSTEQPQQALLFERQDVRVHGAGWARADGSMVIKGAKEAEQGSAAVAELSRPGKQDAANALIAFATEEMPQ